MELYLGAGVVLRRGLGMSGLHVCTECIDCCWGHGRRANRLFSSQSPYLVRGWPVRAVKRVQKTTVCEARRSKEQELL